MNSTIPPQRTGRHFLQIPGPTNIPDRILRAMDYPIIDHRGPEFAALSREILASIRPVFGTEEPVIIFPSSSTGAWEACLVNTLSPGDRIVTFDIGHFSMLWANLARRLGLEIDIIPGEWGRAPDLEHLETKLHEDRTRTIKAVCILHNETSTGVTANIPAARQVLDTTGHGALLFVDAVSSLGAIEYNHDDWGVDVTICGSQKGLMLPPGLSFNAISPKALTASKKALLPRSYWDWEAMLEANRSGAFPYTPATNLLYGLKEALIMLNEEGLNHVFSRHERLARACRAAVDGWDLTQLCPIEEERSNTLTAVRIPNANALRQVILNHYDLSLGAGLGKLTDRIFRIGHLGHYNEIMLAGTLCGIELGLRTCGYNEVSTGVLCGLDSLLRTQNEN